MTDDKFKMDEKGNLIIDIYQWIEQLPDEQKQELAKDNAWATGIVEGMLESLRDGFATEGFNSTIYKIRTALLSSEHAPEMVREWVRGVLMEIEANKRERAYFDKAYWTLWHAWSKMRDDNPNIPRPPELPDRIPYHTITDAEIAEFMKAIQNSPYATAG